MKKLSVAALAFVAASQSLAMGDGDPVVISFSLNEFESKQQSGDDPLAWGAELSIGTDLHGLVLESEGERVEGSTEEHEVNLFYTRAISPFWNANVGWRGDVYPDPERHWLRMGVDGELPFFIEAAATLFVGNHGRTGLSLEAEKEMMLTQRWSLTPELSADFHGHNDEETGTGSGFSGLEAAVRLAYEVTPYFAPYVGVVWEKSYGNTADFARAEGEDTESSQVLVGFRLWF